MIRFICFLFGKIYEPCKSCETLKQELAFERSEKQQLTETLLSIIKPKVYEAPSQEISPIVNSSALFSRRRAALEARDREEAKIRSLSPNLGKPDDKLNQIGNLEKELGVQEEKEGV